MKVLASALLLVGLVACGPGESEITPQDSSMQEEGARVGASTGSETLQRCVDTHDPGVDYFPDKVEALHAQAWDVLYEDNYKIVTTYTSVASQHAGTGVEVKPRTYVLVQCGTPVPALDGDLADATVIEVPIATAVDGDDVLLESFDFLGVADGLLGVGGTELTEVEAPHMPSIYTRQQAGDVLVLGYEPNLEVLADLMPDIYIKSSGEEEVFQEIEETLGVPVVLFNPYQESPLGAAEKLKFLSLFYNKEQQANEHVELVISRYLELQNLAEGADTTPRVLMGFVRPNGTWNTRQNDRYEMILVRDAGGQRVLDLPGNGFANVDLEVVVDQGHDADFWFNLAWLPPQRTVEEFIEASPEIADFRAIRRGNVFHRFGSRGIDYAYNGNIEPDVVLADLIRIMYPDLLPEHEVVYLQPVPFEP